MRRLFAAIGRALRKAFGLPFLLFGGLVAGLFGGGYDEPALEEVIEENVEADVVEEITAVKRWCADVIAGRPTLPLPGRLAGWSRAIMHDREIVTQLATGAIAGRLQQHLCGKQQFPGVPPVGSFADTREWIKARDVGRRYKAERAGPVVMADLSRSESRHPQEQPAVPDPRDAPRYARLRA